MKYGVGIEGGHALVHFNGEVVGICISLTLPT